MGGFFGGGVPKFLGRSSDYFGHKKEPLMLVCKKARHQPNAQIAKSICELHLQSYLGRAPVRSEASFTVSLHFRLCA